MTADRLRVLNRMRAIAQALADPMEGNGTTRGLGRELAALLEPMPPAAPAPGTADRLGTIDQIVAEMRSWSSGRGNGPPPCVTDWADRLAALTPAAGGAELEDWVIARFRAPLITFIRQHAEFTRYPGEDSRPAGYVDALMVRLERHLTGVEPLTTATPAPPPAGYTLAQIRTAWEAGAPGSMRTWDELAAALSAPPPADAVRALDEMIDAAAKAGTAGTTVRERAEWVRFDNAEKIVRAALSAAPAGEGLPTEADFARIASSLAAQQEPSLPITSDMLADMLDPPAAPPPADAVRALVDDAMVERFGVAFFGDDSWEATRNHHNGKVIAEQVRKALEAALSAAPCPCNAPTCAEPWEPGCGLGTSEAHAAPALGVTVPPGATDWGAALGDAQKAAAAPTPEGDLTARAWRIVEQVAGAGVGGYGQMLGGPSRCDAQDLIAERDQQEGGR